LSIRPLYPLSPIQVEERINHPEWRNVDYPGVDFVGAEDAHVGQLGPVLVDVAEKVFLLTIHLAELPHGQERRAYGQLGFLLSSDDDDKQGEEDMEMKPRLVTAQHNIVLEKKYRYLYAATNIGADPCVIDFPEACDKKVEELRALPLRRATEFSARKYIWEHGKQGTEWGEFAGRTPPDVMKREHCFSMVRKDFKIGKGQRVGIAVCMPPDEALCPSLRKAYPHLQEETLRGIFGRAKDRKANIYAGEIQYVGERHIEYDLNSFEGCSGAIVFLLDKGQPEDQSQKPTMAKRLLCTPVLIQTNISNATLASFSMQAQARSNYSS